jgi:hypothetical protein
MVTDATIAAVLALFPLAVALTPMLLLALASHAVHSRESARLVARHDRIGFLGGHA